MKNNIKKLNTYSKKKNVCFVSTHPIQYQVPIYKELNRLKNFNSLVLYTSQFNKKMRLWDKELNKKINWGTECLANYNYFILNNKNFLKKIFFIRNFLIKEKIDYLIISGWNNINYLIVIILSSILKIKLILRCENNFENSNKLKINIKAFFLNFFIKKIISFFLAIGVKNKKYYVDIGIDKKKIFNAPYFVDNNFFSPKLLGSKKKNQIKKFYFKNNKINIIFVGKLISRKGIDIILELTIFLKKKNISNNYNFIIIGDGVKKNKIIDKFKKANIDFVNFIGHQSQDNLRYFYFLSDYLILPSYYETWGLVANESMMMGTPCIVSSNCGCAGDLVKNNQTGIIFKNLKELENLFLNLKTLNGKKKFKKKILNANKHFNLKNTILAIKKIVK